MNAAGSHTLGWIVRASLWLRQLNRHRRMRRKVAAQRAADKAWLAADDPLRPEVSRALTRRARELPTMPLISIVLVADAEHPTAEPGWPWQSEPSPWYPHCEVLAVSPHTLDSSASGLLQRFAAAVRAARGEAVIALPADARLAPHAPLLLAEAMLHFADWQLIYSDHDSITAEGVRHSPCMLCDWNLELLRAHDYLNGALVLRREALLPHLDALCVETAPWRNLVFRLTERGSSATVVHVPHVLWHRQCAVSGDQDAASAVSPGAAGATPVASIASHGSPAPADIAELRAVQSHLERCGVAGNARASPEGGVHVSYALPRPAPQVSLIIPTRNGLHLLRQCVESIFKHTSYPNYDLVVVNNGSDDSATINYLRTLATHPRVCVLDDDRPFNFSALNNAAVRHCRGSVLGMVNNDIEVLHADWLDEMAGLAMRPDVGAVGARLWFPDHTLQHAGVVLGIGGVAGHVHRLLPRHEPGYLGRAVLTQEFSAVTGACMLLRREVFEAVGGLNESDLGVDFNDIDLCLRIRERGWGIVWTPHAQLYHHESATRGPHRPEQRQRFKAESSYMRTRWGHLLDNDPAYNPNLGLRATNFGFAAHPRVSLRTRWFDAR